MTHLPGTPETLSSSAEQHMPADLVRHEELLHSQDGMHALLADSVRRIDYFADDASDEFRITREDGTEQGIFKVWSHPIIAVLETRNADTGQALETWSGRLRDRPLSLFESLEQWRGHAEVSDRRLQQIFEKRPMPTEPEDAIAEQFARLGAAFAYAAPFYNLEALVADSRPDRHDNPIDFSEENAAGGKLDAVAMLLPAALQNHVIADRLEWHDLTWEELDSRVNSMRQAFLERQDTMNARQYVQVSKIAALANMEPADILFAANALQFIPADVGGKREDLPQDEAMAALNAVLDTPAGTVTTGSVAKDANAFIRFSNWSTVIKTNDNFTGKYWAYDAVCSTASHLVEAVKINADSIFEPKFARKFNDVLAPQLNDLDAASAKGRFMGQLLSEGKFRDALTQKILTRSEECYGDVFKAMLVMQQQETTIPLGRKAPTLLVGGKAIGLARATQLFGSEKVLGGEVVTTEAVGTWLSCLESLDYLVDQLEETTNPAAKVAIGEHIIARILNSKVPDILVDAIQASYAPDKAIVLRSSSFDEDVDIIGPAPGVYESEINIPAGDREAISAGLKSVVASFFSDKAISFRELKGLRHTPLFAVLVQEFQRGAGGSIFIKDGHITLNIAPSPSQINDIGEATIIEEHVLSASDTTDGIESSRMSASQIKDIVNMACAAEAIWGPSDLEFVINPTTQSVQLLQMRSLERPVIHSEHRTNEETGIILPVNDVATLPDLPDGQRVILAIDGSIDLEKFQGSLFRWIIGNRTNVQSIVIPHSIPRTCHFVNIIESLGISVHTADNS